MIIRRLRATHLRIPLREPFATAAGTLAMRETWILALESDDGVVGTGEAAPLVGHGLPPGPPVDTLLEAIQTALPLPLAALPLPGGATATEAAVRCAIETAQLDLLGLATDRPIADVFGARREAVPLNAIVGASADEELMRRASAAAAAGFGAIKLKVGARPLLDDVHRVGRVRQALGPGVHLRLDANGAWDAANALAALKAMQPLGIEYIEQPIPPGQPATLRRVRDASAIPIAADEDVWSPEAGRRLLEAQAVDVLVLKPMVLGGLRAALALALEAHARGVRCVVTTTIESGVATAAALHLAAALPGALPACGLATASLLETDLLVQPLPIVEGTMPVPRRPGLGVTIDPRLLDRYAVDEASRP